MEYLSSWDLWDGSINRQQSIDTKHYHPCYNALYYVVMKLLQQPQDNIKIKVDICKSGDHDFNLMMHGIICKGSYLQSMF